MSPTTSGSTARDLDTMTDPNTWVAWPLLPLKRRTAHESQIGLLLDQDEDRWTVYLTNLFAPDLANCERLTYDSPESILSAGWRVD